MSDDFKSKKQPTGDYDVGYCRPPKSGQWQKNQSGNPKGRRKQRLITDFLEAYHEAGREIVSIPIRGKMRRMTLVQAEAFKARFDAALGDARARRDVIRVEEMYARRNSADETKGGWTIIDARPVFDEEEDRGWNKLAKENEQFKQLIAELQSQLEALSGIRRLAPPGGSAEDPA